MAFPITPSPSTEFKKLNVPNVSETLEVTDQKVRDITLYYETVDSQATCPDCFEWEGTTGGVTVTSADKRAIYMVPANKVGEDVDSTYIETYVANGQWERFGAPPNVATNSVGIIEVDTTHTSTKSVIGTDEGVYNKDKLEYNFRANSYSVNGEKSVKVVS